jgi:hypothetical protein
MSVNRNVTVPAGGGGTDGRLEAVATRCGGDSVTKGERIHLSARRQSQAMLRGLPDTLSRRPMYIERRAPGGS